MGQGEGRMHVPTGITMASGPGKELRLSIRLSRTLCRDFLWWPRWRTKKTMDSFINFWVTWANHLMSYTSLSSLVRWGRNNTQQPHTGTEIHIKVKFPKWSDTDTNTGFFITTGRSSWREMKKGRAFKFSATGLSCPEPLLRGKILYSICFSPRGNSQRAPPAMSLSSIFTFAI